MLLLATHEISAIFLRLFQPEGPKANLSTRTCSRRCINVNFNFFTEKMRDTVSLLVLI